MSAQSSGRKLELDEQEAFFLHLILDNSLDGIFSEELFKTEDENGKFTYDKEFFKEIDKLRSKIHQLRFKK